MRAMRSVSIPGDVRIFPTAALALERRVQEKHTPQESSTHSWPGGPSSMRSSSAGCTWSQGSQ